MIRSRVRKAAGIGLVLGSVSLALGACGGGENAPRAGGGPGRGMAATAVEVRPVEIGRIARAVTVSGVVEPIRQVAVNSQLSGALLSVNVEEGDEVREGQLLARMDDRELRAQLAAAEAAFEVARAAFERAEQLRDRKVITLPEYERERTAYAAAKSQLDQLRTRVAFAAVTAPITGVVTQKLVEAGDVVGTNARLFTLADVSTKVVRVGVSELDVVELTVGDEVGVVLDAFPSRSFRGRIRRIFPSADPATRLVPVEVALEGEAATLARPGFLARTTFALNERDNVLLVPASALVRGTTGEAVFIVENGTALRRNVTTGVTSDGRVEIITGLRAGDQVVTKGNTTLRDGAAVRIVASFETEAAALAAPTEEDRS